MQWWIMGPWSPPATPHGGGSQPPDQLPRRPPSTSVAIICPTIQSVTVSTGFVDRLSVPISFFRCCAISSPPRSFVHEQNRANAKEEMC